MRRKEQESRPEPSSKERNAVRDYWTGLKARSGQHERDLAARWPSRDAKVNTHFRQLDDGRLIFYPVGALGRRGFIVTTAEQEASLRRRVREWGVGANVLALGLLFAFLMDRFANHTWLYVAGIIGYGILVWGSGHAMAWPITRHMERGDIANSPIEHWRALGRTSHPFWLILYASYGPMLIGACSYGYSLSHDWTSIAFAVMSTAFVLPAWVALISWWKSRNA
jgi:hypothetical protein